MGICEVLTIIFAIAKLMGVVTWSWWIVFIPEFVAIFIYACIFVTWLYLVLKKV